MGESFVTLVSALLVTIWVARIIEPGPFGLAAIALFIGTIAETIVLTPFAEAIVRRRNLDVGVLDTAHTATVTLSLVVAAGTAASAPLFAEIYQQPDLAPLIAVQSLATLCHGLRSAPEAVLSRKMRFRALAKRGIAAKTLSAGLTIALALAGTGAWSLVVGNVAFAAISALLVSVSVPRRMRLRLRFSEAGELFTYGRFSLADALLSSAIPRVFGLLVGYFQGISAVGFLNIAFRVTEATSSLLHMISARMALPMFSRYATTPHQMEIAYATGTRMIAMASTPVFAGIAVMSPWIIALLLGEGWEESVLALTACSIFSCFHFSRILTQPALKALGKPAALMGPNIAGLVFIIASSLAASQGGLAAHLGLWAVYGPVYFALSAHALKVHAGISWDAQLAPLTGSTLSAGLMIAAVLSVAHYTDLPDLQRALLQIGAGAITYVISILLLERKFLWAIVRTAS